MKNFSLKKHVAHVHEEQKHTVQSKLPLKIHVNIQSLLHDMIHDTYKITYVQTESEKKPKIVHYFQMKLYGRYFNM